MKLRYLIPFTLLVLVLSACNLTLAEDVTPPPNYVPPTPMPTLGPVYPAETPSLANGATIYVEKCAPCHGDTGLGDGEQGLQLPVSVKAFGLPEIGRAASPEQYYTVVTQGNIERFMPPFASLTDQERWDVVAYVLTLHTTPEQIEFGRELFETNCADCTTELFIDQIQMSKLSAVELARLAREGADGLPAFGANLSEAELWAVAAYLRTLSVDASTSPEVASISETPIPAETESAAVEATPVEQEPSSSESVAEGYGSVSGVLENKTGAPWPTDLVITLQGFDHASGASAGAEQVFSQTGEIDHTGAYTFENIELPVGRIFLLEAAYSGITLQSELGIVEAGQVSLTLPNLTLHKISPNTDGLVIDELDIIIHPSEDATSYEVYAVYSFRNQGESVVAVKTDDQEEIPFLRFPDGAAGLGYEAMSDSAPLINLDNGFGLAPSERTYGIIAYSSFARQDKTTLTQTVVLPTAHVRILVPDGMEISGDGLVAGSPQTIQGAVYQLYTATDLQSNEALTFEVSGAPRSATAPSGLSAITSNNDLLVGLGVGLGVIFILAGVWMYVRDRKMNDEDDLDEADESDDTDETDDDEDEQAEFKSSEEILDAIITLDDLHRAKKISDQAYQKRRAELKEMLKGKL